MTTVSRPIIALAAAACLVAGSVTARAADPAALPLAEKPAEEAKESGISTPETELTPEEKAEREARKACKITVCAALRNKAAGDDIACDITKSFRKTQLDKLVGKAKVSWPWGRVVCTSAVKLKRDALMKGMSEPKSDAELGPQSAKCTVERDKDTPADITFEFSPKVSFENGKAVTASMNWGKVDGPKLIKGLMWTATATDNTLNVLGSMLVDDMNTFATATCDELKDSWASK